MFQVCIKRTGRLALGLDWLDWIEAESRPFLRLVLLAVSHQDAGAICRGGISIWVLCYYVNCPVAFWLPSRTVVLAVSLIDQQAAQPHTAPSGGSAEHGFQVHAALSCLSSRDSSETNNAGG
jgi:hypothetical protein